MKSTKDVCKENTAARRGTVHSFLNCFRAWIGLISRSLAVNTPPPPRQTVTLNRSVSAALLTSPVRHIIVLPRAATCVQLEEITSLQTKSAIITVTQRIFIARNCASHKSLQNKKVFSFFLSYLLFFKAWINRPRISPYFSGVLSLCRQILWKKMRKLWSFIHRKNYQSSSFSNVAFKTVINEVCISPQKA